METHYAAHGLALATSFELTGADPLGQRRDNLPVLQLALRDPADLQHAWSGSADPPVWRGRQGDGYELTIERGAGDDVLFTYGNRACFRLHADLRSLDCAPRQSELDWQRVLIGKVIPTISVMRGYEALHAAVLDSPRGLVAIMGPSGAGKSTLAVELLGRGFKFFADDQLTLGRSDHGVWGYPGSRHMNVAEPLPGGVDDRALGATLARFADERWVSVMNTTTRPRPVATLCLLERVPGKRLETRTVSPSPLLLAPYMLGLSNNSARRRSRFSLYADLMESATLTRLTADTNHRPAQLADVLERTLATQAESVGGLAI
jgi:hypothetical protein